MIDALNAEALLLRRRPMPAVLGGSWLFLVLAFAFVVPYIVYSTLDPADTQGRADLLAVLVPASLHATAASSYPLFGGAIMLILGVLVTGTEYRWNTWTARFTQGPGRSQVVLAKLVAGGGIALAIVLCATLTAAAAATVIALIERASLAWPSPGQLLGSVAAVTLISVAWMSVGAALGILFRGTTTALAIGLFWTLGLENALSGIAGMFSALEPVRTVLLGPASGSLVAGLGARTQGDGGTPGVSDYLSVPAAIAVLVAYTVASTLIASTVVQRRDIT